jgi:hypothetical protein
MLFNLLIILLILALIDVLMRTLDLAWQSNVHCGLRPRRDEIKLKFGRIKVLARGQTMVKRCKP